LAESGSARLHVNGTSMMPTLAAGDLVRVEPVGRPVRGDVVTFSCAGVVVTHRIVRIKGDAIVCQGDGRRDADEPVPAAALIGKVVDVIGKGPLRGGRLGLWSIWARRLARRARRRA
jgi:phage repressor protein C with HTH and peptisase S24 domain